MNKLGKIKEALPCSFEWTIENYFSLSQKVNTFYESPDFIFRNAVWYLTITIYPNDDKEESNSGWIGLFLFKRSGQCTYHVTCKISIKDEDGEDYQHTTFECNLRNKSGYGVPQFLKQGKLLKDRRKIAPADILTFSCTLSLDECPAEAVPQSTAVAKNTDTTNRGIYEEAENREHELPSIISAKPPFPGYYEKVHGLLQHLRKYRCLPPLIENLHQKPAVDINSIFSLQNRLLVKGCNKRRLEEEGEMATHNKKTTEATGNKV